MSLLDENMSKCTMLRETVEPDGYGGTTHGWTDGDSFYAAVVLNDSAQTRKAEQEGTTNTFTVTTRKKHPLKFHDVFRREKDEKTFRVTSDGEDKHTPDSATLDMTQVEAEEWGLING